MRFKLLRGGDERFMRLLHGKDQPHQFFNGMRQCDVVVLALGTFLGQISREGRVPQANLFRGIIESIAQIFGASLLHM